MPISVTIDGALDAIAHTFEVFCGATPETNSTACEFTRGDLSVIREKG